MLVVDLHRSLGGDFPNPYPYVWLKFGGKWVLFQSKLEQEGYAHMGMFFSNMGTLFCSHEATALTYHVSDTLTGLTFWSHTC